MVQLRVVAISNVSLNVEFSHVSQNSPDNLCQIWSIRHPLHRLKVQDAPSTNPCLFL